MIALASSLRSASVRIASARIAAALFALGLVGCPGSDQCIGLCVRFRDEVAACHRACPDPWSDPACVEAQTPDPSGHCNVGGGFVCDTPLKDAGLSCDLRP